MTDEERRAALAERLGLITESELIQLAGVTPMTAETWRKRGVGPDYVLIGTRYYYPIDALQKFLDAKTRRQRNVAGETL